MVSLLQQYFGSGERITFEKSRFLWNPDDPTSQLYINNIDNVDFKNMGQRPSLLVDLENHSFPKEVIGDREYYDPKEGAVSYNIRDKSAWSIECWGLKKLESMSLADEVRFFISTFRHEIAKIYKFDQIRVSQQLKPVKYQDFAQYWIARVIVEFELQENWFTTMESLKCSGFGLKLNAKS